MKTNNTLRKTVVMMLVCAMLFTSAFTLAACGSSSSTTAATSTPTATVTAEVSPEPTPTPMPTVIPSAIPTAPPAASSSPTVAPTTAPTQSPSSKTMAVTKDPTDEYAIEGAKVLFIAKASNYKSIEWYIHSKDGNYGCAAADAPTYFSGLSVWGTDGETLVLYNVPTSINGWYAVAKFTGNNGEVLYSKSALISVSQKETQVSVNPAGGTFDSGATVTLKGQSGAQIYYNVQYSGGYSFDGYSYVGRTIYIPAVYDGVNYAVLSVCAVSNPKNSARYDFVLNNYTVYVSTPTVYPDGGTFTTGQTVTLSADPGASIYYTLNGGDPTRGTLYTGPLYIGESCTLTAVAVIGNTYSSICSYDFYISSYVPVTAPAVSPDGYGEYFDDIWVSLYSDYDATIYYTTDGSDPIYNGIQYQGGVYIPYSPNTVVTLKAVALIGNSFSSTTTVTYYFGTYYDTYSFSGDPIYCEDPDTNYLD